jgi:tetratricopeptide (TPR) repeat protein
VHALRDASWKIADEAFEKATLLDPDMALAHVRAAFTARDNRPTQVRRHLARATQLRDSLSERDRMFLSALDPLLGKDPPDEAESVRRFAAAVVRFPGDAELVGLNGFIGRSVLTKEAALALVRRSVTLDSGFADGWQTLGDIAGDLGRIGEAREALQRCVEISPQSTDCRVHLAFADEVEGRCDAAEQRLRDLVASRPEMAATPVPLWPSALLANGGSRDAVEQALEQRWAMLATERVHYQLMESALLEAFFGQFDAALRRLDELDDAARTARGAQVHAVSTALRVDILMELGRSSDAAKAASSFLKKKDAWTAITTGADPTPRLLYVAHAGGLLDDQAFVAARSAWVKALGSLAGRSAWSRGYGPSATASEAAEALAALPVDGLPKSYFRHTEEAADVGRILLLAGRAADAVPLLTIGARSCRGLLDPLGQMRASDLLGQALEGAGDMAAACSAYKAVRDRMRAVRPRSVTADHAIARSKTLGCED